MLQKTNKSIIFFGHNAALYGIFNNFIDINHIFADLGGQKAYVIFGRNFVIPIIVTSERF